MVIDRRRGRYVPRIDRRKCRRCGMCVDVCPGPGLDFEDLNASLFGDIPEEPILGKYLGVYIGHATDHKVRHDGASGGLVTALLICALEEGLIDGALVTRMRADRPLEAEPFIARTRQDIMAAARSKYCPVPANVAVKTLLAEEGRFAVVGLPCHIQGIRLAEQRIEGLKERVRYRISLTCSLNYSFRGTEHILKGLGIAPRSVRALEYRGRGWPGSMLIRTNDGTDTIVPLADYYGQLEPYSLGRCTLCSDLFGELSDLSCGDARTREAVRADKSGSSFAVTRTPEAEELLERAAAQEAVCLSELALRELLASQTHAAFKKRKLESRMRLMRLAGKRVPHYCQKLSEPVEGDFLDSLRFYVRRLALGSGDGFLSQVFHVATGLARKRE